LPRNYGKYKEFVNIVSLNTKFHMKIINKEEMTKKTKIRRQYLNITKSKLIFYSQ